jgi:hypothetical protein
MKVQILLQDLAHRFSKLILHDLYYLLIVTFLWCGQEFGFDITDEQQMSIYYMKKGISYFLVLS